MEAGGKEEGNEGKKKKKLQRRKEEEKTNLTPTPTNIHNPPLRTAIPPCSHLHLEFVL